MKSSLLLAFLATFALAQAPKQLTPDTVVAKIEGKDVTLGEVRKILESSPPQMTQLFQRDPQAALANYFALRYLAAEGEKQKLAEKSPLKEQLEMMRANILAGAMVNQERDLYPVSTEQIEAKYQRDRANYEEAHIKAIFIAFKSSTAAGGTTPEDIQAAAKRALEAAHSPSQRTEAEAKTLAGDIANKIRNGADFAKMVAEFSDDESSKASGGDFGVIKPNSSYPEDLRKAVFALSPGQISDPIRQPSGFYILRLDSKSLTPLADVREQIVQTLRQEHLGEFMNQMNTRFRPVVVEQEIFMRPQTVLGQ